MLRVAGSSVPLVKKFHKQVVAVGSFSGKLTE